MVYQVIAFFNPIAPPLSPDPRSEWGSVVHSCDLPGTGVSDALRFPQPTWTNTHTGKYNSSVCLSQSSSSFSELHLVPLLVQRMRLLILTMAFALANSVSASALSRLPSPRDVAHPQSNVAQFEGFPVTAQSNSRRRRSPLLGPTNGDLMKR